MYLPHTSVFDKCGYNSRNHIDDDQRKAKDTINTLVKFCAFTALLYVLTIGGLCGIFVSTMQTQRSTYKQMEGTVQGLQETVLGLQEKVNSSDPQVAFAVANPNGTRVRRSVYFSTVVLNVGGGYNQTSSLFTCPYAGTYYFAVTLFSPNGRRSRLLCYIRKNYSNDVAHAYSYTGNYDSASTSVFLQLSVGDTVDLWCYPWEYVYTRWYYISYTGSLIREN